MSTRIELIGQGYTSGSNPDGSIKIERPFPGILNGQISESEWTSFCDRVDHKLERLADFKRKAKKMIFICLVSLIILSVLFVVLPVPGGLSSLYIYIPVSIIVYAILYFYIISPMNRKGNEALNDLKQVCDDETKKIPNVSFHLREARQYTSGGNGESQMYVIRYIECIVTAPSNPTRKTKKKQALKREKEKRSTRKKPSIFDQLAEEKV